MLKKLIIENDPIIGDLTLDFTINNNQNIARNIIFIGENGTCKSRILKIISGDDLVIRNNKDSAYKFIFEKDIFWLKNKPSENGYILWIQKNDLDEQYWFQNNIVKFLDGTNNLITNGFYNNDVSLDSNKSNNRSSSDSQNVIEPKSKFFLENQNISNEIIKLNELSNHIYISETKEKETARCKDEWSKTPFSFFVKIYNSFFEKENYKETLKIEKCIIDKNEIIFEKNGFQISLDSLSDGEKLILVKLAKMLTKTNSFDNFRICLDELDIKLHPEWQMKILPFLNEQLPNNNQFFIATHSPFIVHSDCESKKIIELKWNDDKLNANYEPEYYIYKEQLEKIREEIWNFNDDIDTIYVEGKTDKEYWDEFLNLSEERKWKIISVGGSDILKKRYIKFLKEKKNLECLHIFVFDCDFRQEKDLNNDDLEKNKNLKYHILKRNPNNCRNDGIENLLNITNKSDNENINNLYTKITFTKSEFFDKSDKFDKTKLSGYICSEKLDKSTKEEIFKNFFDEWTKIT